ncbi:MAG: hypothetical protein HC848_08990 [Limnobacter sp.]|nr:hypothetical protein [Limnobacter sp.]
MPLFAASRPIAPDSQAHPQPTKAAGSLLDLLHKDDPHGHTLLAVRQQADVWMLWANGLCLLLALALGMNYGNWHQAWLIGSAPFLMACALYRFANGKMGSAYLHGLLLVAQIALHVHLGRGSANCISDFWWYT